MSILTIPREGPHRRIGYREGAIPGDRIPQGGPHRRIRSSGGGGAIPGTLLRILIPRRIRIYIPNGFRIWIRGLWDEFRLKNRMQKISCQCPFKLTPAILNTLCSRVQWFFKLTMLHVVLDRQNISKTILEKAFFFVLWCFYLFSIFVLINFKIGFSERWKFDFLKQVI